MIGDQAVDVDVAFWLLLVTEAAAEAPLPHLRLMPTIANCMPTRTGLEATLLEATLRHRQPQFKAQLRCETSPPFPV